MKRKILSGIDIPYSPSCGSTILCHNVLNILAKDYSIDFLTYPGDTSYDAFKNQSYNVSYLPEPLKKLKSTQSDNYLDELPLAIKEIAVRNNLKPDILLLNHLAFGMSYALLKCFHDIPSVALCHGTDIFEARKSDFQAKILKFISENSDVLIFPNTYMHDEYNELIHQFAIKPPQKTMIIKYGVPTDEIKKIAEESSLEIKKNTNDLKKLVYAGRLTEEKGILILLKTIELLPENYTLDYIGRGPLKETLIKQIDFINKDLEFPKVNLLDHLKQKDLWRKMLEYDAVIMPSIDVEAFGLIAIEVQAIGKPIVYFETNGLLDTIGDSGLSCKAENGADGLKELIVKLLTNGKLYKHYVKLGFENAKMHDVKITSALIDSLFKKIFNLFNAQA